VGVNVNQHVFPEPIRDSAVSMRNMTGKVYTIENVFQDYMLEMERLYHSQEDVIAAWLRYTRMIGQTIRVTQHRQAMTVKVIGLSPEGYLQVEHADGRCETWMSTTHLEMDRAY
jgi:biotin-(acetyl-CoA carboxylase) ligase